MFKVWKKTWKLSCNHQELLSVHQRHRQLKRWQRTNDQYLLFVSGSKLWMLLSGAPSSVLKTTFTTFSIELDVTFKPRFYDGFWNQIHFVQDKYNSFPLCQALRLQLRASATIWIARIEDLRINSFERWIFTYLKNHIRPANHKLELLSVPRFFLGVCLVCLHFHFISSRLFLRKFQFQFTSQLYVGPRPWKKSMFECFDFFSNFLRINSPKNQKKKKLTNFGNLLKTTWSSILEYNKNYQKNRSKQTFFTVQAQFIWLPCRNPSVLLRHPWPNRI